MCLSPRKKLRVLSYSKKCNPKLDSVLPWTFIWVQCISPGLDLSLITLLSMFRHRTGHESPAIWTQLHHVLVNVGFILPPGRKAACGWTCHPMFYWFLGRDQNEFGRGRGKNWLGEETDKLQLSELFALVWKTAWNEGAREDSSFLADKSKDRWRSRVANILAKPNPDRNFTFLILLCNNAVNDFWKKSIWQVYCRFFCCPSKSIISKWLITLQLQLKWKLALKFGHYFR